jgi:hypothetical protein
VDEFPEIRLKKVNSIFADRRDLFSIRHQMKVQNIDTQRATLVFGSQPPHIHGSRGGFAGAGKRHNPAVDEAERLAVMGKKQVDFPGSLSADKVVNDSRIGKPPVVSNKIQVFFGAVFVGQVEAVEQIQHFLVSGSVNVKVGWHRIGIERKGKKNSGNDQKICTTRFHHKKSRRLSRQRLYFFSSLLMF